MFKFIIKHILLLAIFSGLSYTQSTKVIRFETYDRELPLGLSTKSVKDLPQIGLALSGGGSRGLSQIGVIKAFEEKRITFDMIVGTSMGSIVGGLYSVGYSIGDLDSIVSSANWADFSSSKETNRKELFIDQKITQDKAILALRIDGLKPILPTSISTGQKISNFFSLLALNAPIHAKDSFESLFKNFKAVATDLVSGNLVVLDSGSLSQTMRASSSVSFLLSPVEIDSLMLVDGGLVSNIPVSITKKSGCEYIIAVNSTSPLHSKSDLQYPWYVADQIISIPMQQLNEKELSQADWIITPELPSVNIDSFDEIQTIIEAGYNFTISQIDSLKKSINHFYRSYIINKHDDFIIQKPLTSHNNSPLEISIAHKLNVRDTIRASDLYLELIELINSGEYENVWFELDTDSNSTGINISSEIKGVIRSISISNTEEYIHGVAYYYFNQLIGSNLNNQKILNLTLECLRHFRKEGFSFIDVEKITFDKLTEQLNITFSDGVLDDLVISGNLKTEDEIILREIPLKSGQLLNYNLIEAGLTNLRSTNLFEEVEAIFVKEGKRNVLKIKIKERPSLLLRFGLRIDNEKQAQTSFDFRDENFLGTGTDIGAIFTTGARNRSFTLEHKANRIFDTYLTYKLKAFYGFEDYYNYIDKPTDSERRFKRIRDEEYRYVYSGASFALGKQVQKLGNLIAEVKYQRDIIKNKLDYTGPTYTLDLISLKFSLNIDTQNEFPYPTDGLKINSFYETGQTLLAGDVGYSKFLIDYQIFIPLNTHHVIKPRFVIGFADETLPLSQQFSFGGQQDFLGFDEYDSRGRQIFISSLEYRYKLPIELFFETFIKARYDLGSIWTQPEDIKFKDLKHGIGLTLSFNTPVGPADFSVGKGFLIKKLFSESIITWGETHFYFTIGYYY